MEDEIKNQNVVFLFFCGYVATLWQWEDGTASRSASLCLVSFWSRGRTTTVSAQSSDKKDFRGINPKVLAVLPATWASPPHERGHRSGAGLLSERAVRGGCFNTIMAQSYCRPLGSLAGFRQNGCAESFTISELVSGWKILTPARSRKAHPLVVWEAFATTLAAKSWRLMSIHLFLALRSALLSRLESFQTIPPKLESSTGMWYQGPPVSGEVSSSSTSLGFRLPSNLSRYPTCRTGSWPFLVDDVTDQTFRRQQRPSEKNSISCRSSKERLVAATKSGKRLSESASESAARDRGLRCTSRGVRPWQVHLGKG